ncbi:MAG: 2-oxo-4-hydroxy-4-carboxy-5-ureidoimidazoline decarboxylase [Pseudonocardia sp.]
MQLAEFNALPLGHAAAELAACCSSPEWARRLARSRPFHSVAALCDQADQVLATLDEAEIDRALAGHPRIGEHSAHAASQREQAGVAGAGAAVLAELAAGNRTYEQRFGQVYLVCADGRSGAELLAVLRGRLAHDPATERRVLRAELGRINRVRLGWMVHA